MNELAPVNIVFDYTNFLGECSDHQWTFAEVFGLHWVDDKTKNTEQKLWESALHRMSIQYSDEDNIIELIKLAKKLRIDSLRLIMPYSLPDEQLRKIERTSQVKLDISQPDEFIVNFIF